MTSSTVSGDDPIVRKVQIAGGSTFTVSLPKEWAEAQDLEPGSKLRLYALEDRIVVAPESHPPATGSVTIEADGLGAAALRRRVRAAYTAGCDRITVTAAGGKSLSRDQRRAAADALADLVGVEVDRGDRSDVAARSMLDASAVSLEQSLLQLRRLAQSSYREAMDAVREGDEDLAASVQRRTDDVERFVALVGRQFHGVLVDVGEIERLETGRAVAFRDYRTARHLGEIAQDAAAIAAVAREQSGPPAKPIDDRFEDLATLVRDVLGDVGRASPSTVTEGCRAVEEALVVLDRDLADVSDADAHRYGRVGERVRRTCESVTAIAQADFQAELRDGKGG